MSDLTKLVTRLGRHIGRGTGIRLTPDELDLLVTSGAFETLSKVAAAEMREIASQRVASKASSRPAAPEALSPASTPEEARAFIAAMTRSRRGR